LRFESARGEHIDSDDAHIDSGIERLHRSAQDERRRDESFATRDRMQGLPL